MPIIQQYMTLLQYSWGLYLVDLPFKFLYIWDFPPICRCNPLPTAHVCYPLPDRNSLFSFSQPILAGATVSSDSLQFAFLFLAQLRPAPDPDCVMALRHIMCVAARPPCNETVQNLLPICSDSCLAYTRIFEEDTCTPIIEYARTLQESRIELLELFVELFIQVDCTNSSTYYFYEDVEQRLGSGSDGCTDLFPSEDKGKWKPIILWWAFCFKMAIQNTMCWCPKNQLDFIDFLW